MENSSNLKNNNFDHLVPNPYSDRLEDDYQKWKKKNLMDYNLVAEFAPSDSPEKVRNTAPINIAEKFRNTAPINIPEKVRNTAPVHNPEPKQSLSNISSVNS